ncbi:MAG: hypothetical protein MI749_11235, partial [Desulfovibrionales bacterium]|nr:hypothetical protein [Desulfovibrionales bacterium]
FLLATNDGYTFRVMNSGRLVADTVDISDQTTEVLDLATLSAPDLETNFNLPGNQRLFYYGPDSAWGAVTLKGGVHTRLLGGDDGANNLIVLETREAGVTLRGDGGSDTYMVGNTGTYVINNQDTAGDVDTINLMLDFDQLSFSRSGDDLVVENPDASFSLSVSNYMSGADGSDQYRHLNFLSRDKVAFTLVADQVVPTGSSRLKPSITGLDFSSETVSRIIDLRKPSQDFGFASMAVSSFVGSSTAATTVTTGNLDTLVATGSQGDTITTGQGQDTIRSGAGNDQIMAGRGDDMIFAGTGADRVDAGGGNDVLVGGAGADYLYGGSGTDTLMFIGDVENETGVTVNLSTGKGQGADAAGDVYVSIENVYGTDYDDILIGNAQANLLSGGRGTNTLSGHGGNDIFMIGNDSSNTVDGGDGTDLVRYTDLSGGVQVDLSDLSGGRTVHLDARGNATTFVDTLSSIEDVEGSAHRDLITGDAQSNRVLGSMGEDVIDLGAGQDVVDYRSLAFDGNEGIWVDLLHGLPEVEAGDGALSDYLVQMLSHVEAVFGSRANDRIYGSNASDVLAGYKGLDILRGRGGDDTFLAWGDGDAFHGGSGGDTVDYRNMAEGVTASLNTGHGNGLDDFFDIENLSGTLFNDVLEGDDTANTLYGSLGLDELRGLGGDDTLMGIGDGDILDGGAGNDTVTYAQATQGIWATMGLAPLDVDQRRHWENQGNGSRRPDYICGVENLVGSAHGDLVQTSAGADTLDMGDGNDWIVGSRGSDAITGGDGTDSLSYTGVDLDTGVSINLSTHRVTGRSGAAFTDTLTGIERVQGSENNDVITGSTTGQTPGTDYIFASQGQDRIETQTATVVDFSRMYTDQGITLSSETDGYTIAFDVKEESSSTRITGAATVKGSSQNDTFNGGAAADVFEGGLGNDTLSGGTGADTLKGGNGNDTLDGGTGSDTLDGGAGDDTYTFERGDGSASITDASGSDTLDLSRYSANEVAFWMDGEDLLISAGEDNLRIHDQVSDSGSAIDRIRLSNGREIGASNISNLVSAMA